MKPNEHRGTLPAARAVGNGSLKVMEFSDVDFRVPVRPSRSRTWKGTWRRRSPQGGDYADLYFEYLLTSSISMDESMVKSAAQGVSMGVGIRVIAGERTGYAYSDDLSPEKIRKAARVAAHIAAGPSKVEKFGLNEGAAAQPVSGPDGADGNVVRGAGGTGEAGGQGGARLRFADVPGAGAYADNLRHVHGGDKRGRPDAGPAAAGAAERLGAGAAERRRAATGARGRRRPGGARFLPEREDARAFRGRGGAARRSRCWTRWRRRRAR